MFRTAGYYFVGLFALSLAAFWPTYGAGPSAFDPYTHVHAVLMVCWFAVLVAQPFLIRGERRRLHRLLGRASYALVPLLVVSILLLAHARVSASKALDDEAHFFYLPFGMSVLLLVPWLRGIQHRHAIALHARYMIATSLAVVDPVVGRLLFFYGPRLPSPEYATAISYLVTATVLVVLIVRERHQRAGRSAFPFVLGLATVIYALFFTFARTPAWRAFVSWFRELPLT